MSFTRYLHLPHVGTFMPTEAIALIATASFYPTFKQLPNSPPLVEAMGNVPSQPRPTPNFPTNLAKTALAPSATFHAAEASATTMGSLTSATSASYSKTTTLTVPGTLIVDTTFVISVLASPELASSTTELATAVNPVFLFDGPFLPSSTKKEVLMESDSAGTSTASTNDDVESKRQSLDETKSSTSTDLSTSTTTIYVTSPTIFMPTTHEPPSFTDSSSFTFRRCVHSDSPEEGTSDGCVLVVAPLTSGDGGGVPTLPSTPTLTSLSLPTFNATMSSTVWSADASMPTNDTAAAAPLSDSSPAASTSKGSSWSAAKVVAPTIIISVLFAALVLWWLIRRERKKNIERERQIEEKAQFFSQSYCDGLRERMMAVDESRSGVVGEDRCGRVGGGVGSRDGVGEGGRDVRESGWVGGSGSDSASARDRAREEMMERAKERRESVGAIEQEMVSARVEKAGGKTESPVSSLTNSPNVSRDGNAPAEHASSKGSLTALPTENWKVFRGSREIQPYQPSQRKGGEWKPGSVWGKVRRSSIR